MNKIKAGRINNPAFSFNSIIAPSYGVLVAGSRPPATAGGSSHGVIMPSCAQTQRFIGGHNNNQNNGGNIMSNGIKNNSLSKCVDSCYVTDHQVAGVEQTTSRHMTSCHIIQHKRSNNMFDTNTTNIIQSSEDWCKSSTDDTGHTQTLTAIEGQTVNPPHPCHLQSEDDISIVASAASTTVHNAAKQNTTLHIQCDVTNKQEDHTMINKTHRITNTAVDMTFDKFNRGDGMALLKSLSGHLEERTTDASAYARIEDFIRAWSRLTPIAVCSAKEFRENELGHFIPEYNEIRVRGRREYVTDAEFYKVIFHEIIHSYVFLANGNIAVDRNSVDYHRNEICAEMGAMVLLHHFGLDISDIATTVTMYAFAYSRWWDPTIDGYRTIKLRDCTDEILGLVEGIVRLFVDMTKGNEHKILNKCSEEETEMANKALTEVSTMKNKAYLNGLNIEKADRLVSRVLKALYSDRVMLTAHGLMTMAEASHDADDYVSPECDEVIDFWSANVARIIFIKTCLLNGAKGSYDPLFKTISCLDRDHSSTVSDFYVTVFHEMVHSYWFLTHDQHEWIFRDNVKGYAFNEICAEMGSLLLMHHLGAKITQDIIDDVAVYIYGYLYSTCACYCNPEPEFYAAAKKTIELVNGMIELFAFMEPQVIAMNSTKNIITTSTKATTPVSANRSSEERNMTKKNIVNAAVDTTMGVAERCVMGCMEISTEKKIVNGVALNEATPKDELPAFSFKAETMEVLAPEGFFERCRAKKKVVDECDPRSEVTLGSMDDYLGTKATTPVSANRSSEERNMTKKNIVNAAVDTTMGVAERCVMGCMEISTEKKIVNGVALNEATPKDELPAFSFKAETMEVLAPEGFFERCRAKKKVVNECDPRSEVTLGSMDDYLGTKATTPVSANNKTEGNIINTTTYSGTYRIIKGEGILRKAMSKATTPVSANNKTEVSVMDAKLKIVNAAVDTILGAVEVGELSLTVRQIETLWEHMEDYIHGDVFYGLSPLGDAYMGLCGKLLEKFDSKNFEGRAKEIRDNEDFEWMNDTTTPDPYGPDPECDLDEFALPSWIEALKIEAEIESYDWSDEDTLHYEGIL